MSHSLAFTLRQEENGKALKRCTWWSNIFHEHNYITSIAYTISAQIETNFDSYINDRLTLDSSWTRFRQSTTLFLIVYFLAFYGPNIKIVNFPKIPKGHSQKYDILCFKFLEHLLSKHICVLKIQSHFL
jgi:hypothetical protein